MFFFVYYVAWCRRGYIVFAKLLRQTGLLMLVVCVVQMCYQVSFDFSSVSVVQG